MINEKTDFFFVYGTLKEGGHFATDLDPFRVRSEKAELDGFDLFNLGWFPGIKEGNSKVYGEVHEYKNLGSVQQRLDNIEGYNESDEKNSLYLRRRKTVNLSTGKGKIEANVYIFNQNVPSDAKKIESGDWDLEKYSS